LPNITRAFAVHARTLELLDARGMAGELPTRFGMLLIVPQSGTDTENVLGARVDDMGIPVVRGAEVVGLSQGADSVTVACADGTSIQTRYVVGCDGAHSTVRRLVGIGFEGKKYETHILLADVELTRTR
jgi:2-polyprenyl-6-methoxyphenol hydroxylase-like FAD-dependent oxidoreductase